METNTLTEQQAEMKGQILAALKWVEETSFSQAKEITGVIETLQGAVKLDSQPDASVAALQKVNKDLGVKKYLSQVSENTVTAYFLGLDLAAV